MITQMESFLDSDKKGGWPQFFRISSHVTQYLVIRESKYDSLYLHPFLSLQPVTPLTSISLPTLHIRKNPIPRHTPNVKLRHLPPRIPRLNPTQNHHRIRPQLLHPITPTPTPRLHQLQAPQNSRSLRPQPAITL